jgi:hypothetical protein
MSFTSLTFLFSILQALFEVVEQPAGAFVSEKMTSLNFFDMYFVIWDICDQYLCKIERKLNVNLSKLVPGFSKLSSHELPYKDCFLDLGNLLIQSG